MCLVKHYLGVGYCHSVLKGTNPDIAERYLLARVTLRYWVRKFSGFVTHNAGENQA